MTLFVLINPALLSFPGFLVAQTIRNTANPACVTSDLVIDLAARPRGAARAYVGVKERPFMRGVSDRRRGGLCVVLVHGDSGNEVTAFTPSLYFSAYETVVRK